MEPTTNDIVHVQRWPTEQPLFILAVFASIAVWLVLLVSIIGAMYVALIALFLFMSHVALVAHVRGNGVRLGPDQLPELHEMVERLSRRIGLARTPEGYLLQGNGMLNAFATRFLATDIMLVYSDLLDACDGNDAAIEMIVGHELAHIKCRHLRWQWLVLPSYAVPFLGMALSRAREYTCDRYGRALSRSLDGAVLGLTVLAAGRRYGGRVNRTAMVAQHALLNTGWMRLAEWLSTHPPLALRLAELDPSLAPAPLATTRGTVRALLMIGSLVAIPATASAVMMLAFIPKWREIRSQAQSGTGADEPASEYKYEPPPPDIADARIATDLDRIAAFLVRERSAGRPLPQDTVEAYKRWNGAYVYEFEPVDPYSNSRYGYQVSGNRFLLWSSGTDGKDGTDDDVVYDSATGERALGRRPDLSMHLSQ